MKQYIAVAATWLSILRSTAAAPQSPSPPPAALVDKCGPSEQVLNITDTCNTRPRLVSSPFPFGIIGILPESGKYPPMVGQPSTVVGSSYEYNWATCAPVVQQICSTMSNSSTAANKCAGARNDVTQAAPKPTEKQCQNIFNATMSAANTSQDKWMGASINLVKNPANQTGQFSLPGGDGTGAAANRFYPSYFIAAGIPCIDTLTNLGCHRAADGKTCASSSSKNNVPAPPTESPASIPSQEHTPVTHARTIRANPALAPPMARPASLPELLPRAHSAIPTQVSHALVPQTENPALPIPPQRNQQLATIAMAYPANVPRTEATMAEPAVV
ncbi:MAG: hypothetical protein L6R41_005538 [Letrouitia leprolyta]|nr:MAG: hypothetical protein L6R41_005538 [Letrouitia leprolyta]